ncbi:3-methyl-2-oxobutanoate hydroxymethyltransferase [Actinosynnema sp. NPDC020468]|uniref:3-methyl-2-oxobutanoate hydroxymethyltransferase n=1 Tax=Actinosynnema sp. NPDC020468 TaxID=3154488 RepID=UPI0033E9E763
METTPERPPRRRIRIPHLQALKESGEAWPMLTTYDVHSAGIFDDAGIPVLLVGDSAANSVFGHETTIPITIEEMVPLVRAVTRSAKHALVVADLPFGSYQVSVEQAVGTAVRLMKEGRAHAVKLEGGRAFAPHITAVVNAGIPVMGHVGFTPQSEHRLGGYRVQGRGDTSTSVVADAHAVEDAGAFAVVLEMVADQVAKTVTGELRIPTVGIGAGPHTDGQVLVWTDMAGLGRGRVPSFVKRYADLAGALDAAATSFARDVRARRFPGAEHTFT